jgi:hypothetical protein
MVRSCCKPLLYNTKSPYDISSIQQKCNKKKKKLTHTMKNTQRKENRQTTPTKETPGQTKPTAGRGSGPTPVVGLVPRLRTRQNLPQNSILMPHKSFLMPQNPFLMPQNLFLKSNLKPKRKKLTLRDLIT